MPTLIDFGQNKGSIYPFCSLLDCLEQVLFYADKRVWTKTQTFWD